MEDKLRELTNRLIEIDDLESAAALLQWDQSTYMPAGGAAARARQLATLGRLAHEKFTDPAIGKLLEGLRPDEERLPYDSDEASLIRVTRRKYERAVKNYESMIVDGAEVVERDGKRVTYRFDRDVISASGLIGRLSARYRIRDLEVREPDIEATVRRIYGERLLEPGIEDSRFPTQSLEKN